MRTLLTFVAIGVVSKIGFSNDVTLELAQVVRDASRGTLRISTPRDEQLRQAEALFQATLQGAESFDELEQRWQQLDFDLVAWEVPRGHPLWLVREKTNRRSGRGIYALRPQRRSALVVQAPHSSFDRHTREIAVHLVADPRVAAGAWNTVHRSKVDLAHTERHFLNAFTRAVAAAASPAIVLQLHGFTPRRRRTEAGKTADLIVSNGSRLPSQTTIGVAHQLQDTFPARLVRIYPWNVRELGATTNVQGHIVRHAAGEFVSLEMAAELRQQLQANPAKCAQFLKAVLLATE